MAFSRSLHSQSNPNFFLFSQAQNPTKSLPCQLHFSPSKHPQNLLLQARTQQLVIPELPLYMHKPDDKQSPHEFSHGDPLSVAFPSLAFSNTLFFKSAYNVQVVVGDNEPEDRLISRFRREVLKAGILQECKRRRFFETTQEKRKRKARNAARRNRKRRPQPKVSQQVKQEASKKKDDSEDDNWDFVDVELPYC